MKGKNAPRVRAGFVEGMVISPEEVERLSELPSKGVLLEQLASSLVFPPAALVSTLQGILSGLVGILEAIGARKAELFETHSIPK